MRPALITRRDGVHNRPLFCQLGFWGSVLMGLASTAAGPLMAQETNGAAEAAPQRAPGSKLERVEIVGRQTGDNDLRRRSQIAKQIYGREEMDKHGDGNVADVLKRLPGVTMQGNSPRMRGLGSGYTLVLLNGDPAPPGFALDQLDPAQVERIEISKGPTASQSAQAVAGTINIILKEAPKVSQRDMRLGLNYNYARPGVSGNYTLAEKWGNTSLSLPVSIFQWHGLNESMVQRVSAGGDGLPSDATQRNSSVFFGHGFNIGPRLNWRISDDETLSWQSFIHQGIWNNQARYSNQIHTGQPRLDYDSNNHGDWQNLRSNVQWVNHWSSDDRLELKLAVQSSKGNYHNQTFLLVAPQRRTVGSNAETGITQAGNVNHLLGESHSLTAGWELEQRERDEQRTVTELGQPQIAEFEGQPFGARVERLAVYLQDEWEIDKQWSTYVGVRSERIATHSQGQGNTLSNTSAVLTPMWHMNYKLDPAGKDLVRASITRSYKAPELGALLARPSVSGLFPNTRLPNTELAPDRIGNPALRPELATGLDIAFEKYLAGGGLVSVGVFLRQVQDLVRNVSTLQTVGYATVPRWVSQPVNFSQASTTGLELEIKGRAAELMPAWFESSVPLNLRGALNIYQSRVDALSGPDNRLDGQQPWSANLGVDYRMTQWPVNLGSSLSFTPDYLTAQTPSQSLYQGRNRSMDVFAQWVMNPKMSLRLSANNLLATDQESLAQAGNQSSTYSLRSGRTVYNARLEIRL
jgi:outer membrane receptor for ferrienterochelin and colicins